MIFPKYLYSCLHSVNLSPQSLKNGTLYKISQEGEIRFGEDQVVYQLFNLRKINDVFDLFMVSKFMKFDFDIFSSKLKPSG